MTWKPYQEGYVHVPPEGKPVRVRFQDGHEAIMIAYRDPDDWLQFSRAEDYDVPVEAFEMVDPEEDRRVDAEIAADEAERVKARPPNP